LETTGKRTLKKATNRMQTKNGPQNPIEPANVETPDVESTHLTKNDDIHFIFVINFTLKVHSVLYFTAFTFE
jgi:hypothetical protein